MLITEGFTKVEEVAYVGLDELEKIEGFDQDLAQQLQERAKNYIQQQQQQQASRWQDLGVDSMLADVPGLTPELLVTLGEQGVKTLQDFADLSSDELISSEDGLLRKHKLNLASADQMIMAARHMLDKVKK